MKKAQGLSINTIILAALGVLVLLILIAVFSGSMGKTNQQLNKATAGAQSLNSLFQVAGYSLTQFQTDLNGLSECKGTVYSACYNKVISLLQSKGVGGIDVIVEDGSGAVKYPEGADTSKCAKVFDVKDNKNTVKSKICIYPLNK